MHVEGEEFISRVQRRKIKEKRKFFLCFTFFIIFCSFIWYRFFYITTPSYAVKKIGEALVTHDLELFNNYVNLDILILTHYDDLIGNLISYDTKLQEEEILKIQKFYALIKPKLCAGFMKTIRHFVHTGTFEGELKDNILYGRQIGIDYEYLLLRSALKNTIVLDIVSIDTKKDHALVTVKIQDTYTKGEFLLMLYLEETKAGTYRLLYCQNYHQYLDMIAPMHKIDILGYIMATEPLIKKYNQKFIQQKLLFQDILAKKNIDFTEAELVAIENLIQKEIITTLNERQEKLNSFDERPGSLYIAKLRRRSSALSIEFFTTLLEAMKTNSLEKYQQAETLHKEILNTESLLEDIINYKALSLPPKEVR